MCTLTAINLMTGHGEGGFRVVMSRDEMLTRSIATPPQWHEHNGSRAIWPTDPDSGGTWIAAHEDGLTLALVNSFPEPMPKLPKEILSRGTIIPEMIFCEGIEDVIERFDTFPVERFAPFRLVMIDFMLDDELCDLVPIMAVLDWNREEVAVEIHQDGPVCLVSSGLGDDKVAPRIKLFEETVLKRRLTADKQDRYHQHQWHDRPEISVMMGREAARTVSLTTVEVLDKSPVDYPVKMTYRSIPE
jgi:hypothetical protein